MDVAFLIALMQIIGINIILSGDNAVVIALACRSPPRQQKTGIVMGAGAATSAPAIGVSSFCATGASMGT